MDRPASSEPVTATGQDADIESAKTRRKIVTVILIILLLIGIGAAWHVNELRKQEAYDKALALKSDKLEFEGAISESNILRGQRKYDEAIKVLESYLKESKIAENKSYAYMILGNVHESKQDNSKAYQAYSKAAGVQQGQELAREQGLARTSQKLGKKTEAVKHYRRIVELYDILIDKHPDDKALRRDQEFYRLQMTTLEQQL